MKSVKRILYNFKNLPRRGKQGILLVLDVMLLNVSLWLAFVLRIGSFNPYKYLVDDWWLFILLPISAIPFFIFTGLYRSVLQYMGNRVVIAVIKSISFSTILVGFGMMLVREVSSPRSIIFIYWFIAVFTTLCSRNFALWLIYSFARNTRKRMPVAIYGSGEAGAMLSESIQNSNRYKLVAMIDDDYKKHGTVINSQMVHSPNVIEKLISENHIKLILLAIPSIGKTHRRKILKSISQYPVNVMELPSVENIIEGRVTINDVKQIDVEDILGREPVEPVQALLRQNITGKTVLVTGAGGSIGSELCRQIIMLKPEIIILFEQSEFNLYTIHQELVNAKSDIKIIPILASVQNRLKLQSVFNKYNINTVYHAAAYKHVPMVENNPCAAISNNIIGTYHLVTAALENNVNTFVFISTDKAVRPTNVMGATKRFAELILQGLNTKNSSGTCFTMVRFGNVLDSAGSVVPLFREQIKNGGPVTLTHLEITRYFMSIPEAVQLVIQAGAMANGGEVFVLDMGDSIKIKNLAEKMIYLSGFTPIDDENPEGDIAINIIGLRPGEKLYEELLIGNNTSQTDHPGIMKANEKHLNWSIIENAIQEFEDACKNQNDPLILELLQKYVTDYTPAENGNIAGC